MPSLEIRADEVEARDVETVSSKRSLADVDDLRGPFRPKYSELDVADDLLSVV